MFCVVLFISCLYTTSVDGLPCYDGKIVSADKDLVLGGYSYTIQYNIDNQLVTKHINDCKFDFENNNPVKVAELLRKVGR